MLWLVSIKDKSLDEEQVIGWAMVEAANEKAAQDLAWTKTDELADGPFGRRFARLVVDRVVQYKLGEWKKPNMICNRRHRGPDGEFPG